jgi:hypothetical protein
MDVEKVGYTADETAEALGVSVKTVDALDAEGRLERIDFGDRRIRRYSIDSIRDFARRRSGILRPASSRPAGERGSSAMPTPPKPTQRADGRWVIAVQVGRGSRGYRVRRYLYGSSSDDVLAKRDDFLRRAKLGLGPVDERLTVAAYLTSWADGLVGIRPRTIESYRHTVDRHLIPALGNIALVQLRAADIRRATRSIATSTGIRTAAYAVTILRIALSVAVRDRLIERNEASEVRRPVVDEPEREVLDDDGLLTLLDAVRAIASRRCTSWRSRRPSAAASSSASGGATSTSRPGRSRSSSS